MGFSLVVFFRSVFLYFSSSSKYTLILFFLNMVPSLLFPIIYRILFLKQGCPGSEILYTLPFLFPVLFSHPLFQEFYDLLLHLLCSIGSWKILMKCLIAKSDPFQFPFFYFIHDALHSLRCQLSFLAQFLYALGLRKRRCRLYPLHCLQKQFLLFRFQI